MKKIYVLDTNILIHDPEAIFKFEEHHVIIPMTVVEELDKLKAVKAPVAKDAREASRNLKRALEDTEQATIEVSVGGNQMAVINDNKIIECAKSFQIPGRQVILVTKDVNMWLKARAQGLEVEDYRNDEIRGEIPVNARAVPYSSPLDLEKDRFVVREHEGGHNRQIYEVGPSEEVDGALTFLPYPSKTGIKPRNGEQALALSLLENKGLDFILLEGKAGSGKTFLALAYALDAVLDRKEYEQIVILRSQDPNAIGFLPGTEEEKMLPWMQGFMDNLELLVGNDPATIKHTVEKAKIRFRSLELVRGRSYQNAIILADECFKGDTEVLTEEGFIRFDKLESQKIIQVREDGSTESITPLNKINKPYEGYMAKVYKDRFSLEATENHDFVYENDKGELVKCKAKDLPPSNYFKRTSGTFPPGEVLCEEAYITLLCALQADGSFLKTKTSAGNFTKYWSASFSKVEKIERFERALKACKMEYSKYAPDERGRVRFYIPDEHCVSGHLVAEEGKTFIISEILKWAPLALETFLSETLLWDGCTKGTPVYCSTNYENIKVVQTVAHLVGKRARIIISEDNRKENYKTYYRLSIVDTPRISMQKANISREWFKGQVYCVTVPSGMIMVRQGNNIYVTGNCQNNTPHQMKALVTRIGEGSKLICLGNLAQIDTPYLNERTSGLKHLATKMVKYKGAGVMQFNEVHRSALAAFGEENL